MTIGQAYTEVPSPGLRSRRLSVVGLLPRIDHLYFLAALALATVWTSITPIWPNDLWFHMRVGQIIAGTGRVPTTNLFSWAVPIDQPYIYGSWLGELLLYWLHSLGGVHLLVLARNLMAAVAFTLLGLDARRRSGSWRVAGLAVAGVILLGQPGMMLRPQSFTWIPFALYLFVLGGYTGGRLRAR